MSAHDKLQRMHQLSLMSRDKAYCPYSKFAVGSCILGADGQYYTGCNVERAVGSVCAEGTAIVKMVENGCRQLKEVYVVTELTGDVLAAPCGFCRQFIKEFSKNDVSFFIFRRKFLSISVAFPKAMRKPYLLMCFFLTLLGLNLLASIKNDLYHFYI